MTSPANSPKGRRLSLGGSAYDPIGRVFLDVSNLIAKFEADLIRARTREAWPLRKPKDDHGASDPTLPGTLRILPAADCVVHLEAIPAGCV